MGKSATGNTEFGEETAHMKRTAEQMPETAARASTLLPVSARPPKPVLKPRPPPPPPPMPQRPDVENSETAEPSNSHERQATPVPCPGFHEGLGYYVIVSEDGLLARHRDESGEVMHGPVMSKEALVAGRAGLYFEVELVEVRPEEMPDGLTIGVTATDPSTVQEVPATVEHIPHTWTVGYDGQMWDAESCTLSMIDWDPRSLKQGDVVGVLITLSEGELIVFQNGVACCPGPRGIPAATKPLFAVVDLLGAARAVRWRVGALPPIGSDPRRAPEKSAGDSSCA